MLIFNYKDDDTVNITHCPICSKELIFSGVSPIKRCENLVPKFSVSEFNTHGYYIRYNLHVDNIKFRLDFFILNNKIILGKQNTNNHYFSNLISIDAGIEYSTTLK